MLRVTLESLAAQFDAFLIDQFGVLRDDTGLYPGAVESFAFLRARGKRLIILSNSGRSAVENTRRMGEAGIGSVLYDHFVTSGEVAYGILCREVVAPTAAIFEIASGKPTDLPERLGRPRCTTAAAAGLILISGAETERVTMDSYRELLAAPAAACVPALCTNPDLQKIGLRGTLLPGAGALAALYEELGGSVRRIGKPYPDIYSAALALLPGIAADRIICIGDSPAHDIAGARAAGLASCLVETGIGGSPHPSGPAPDFVMAAFAPLSIQGHPFS